MKNGALTWEWNGQYFTCLYTAPYDPLFGVRARITNEPLEVTTPAQLVACLKANPGALTAVQWVDILSAQSREVRDTVTDTLVGAGHGTERSELELRLNEATEALARAALAALDEGKG